MLKNKLNLKFLTSIFIVLFFIVFFHPSCYAYMSSDNYSSFEDLLSKINSNSNATNYINQYNNVLLIRVGNSGRYNDLRYVFSDSDFYFTTSTTTSVSYHGIVARSLYSSDYFEFSYTGDSYSSFSYFYSPFIDSIYVLKGSPTIYLDNEPIGLPISSYDFSFIINDHNFDFNFNGVSFSNGVNIDSDTIKQGQYVCSLYQYEEMTYYNSDYKNYWVSGFLDYYPYNETNPEKYFYESTGYNTLKINDSSGDNDYFYRFYFKGYSSDSSYQNFDNNIITNNVNDFNTYDKYSPFRSSTFFYSNRNIYWGIDSSLYGYNGITTNLYYEEDSSGVNVINVSTTERTSQDPEEDSTTYAIGNNVYNVPSSNANINNNSLHNYNGSSYGSISNYNSEENITGTQILAEDTSNWSTLDYVKHIPTAIGNIPLSIMNMLLKLIIPNHDDLVDIYLGYQQFFESHLGVLNAPISWIFNFLGSIRDKYSENYSYYNFTIPGFRWFNPATGQKETLVESQTINLNTYFVGDEDWTQFWGVLRYTVSILIYINLIIMLYNKYNSIIGGDRVIINDRSGVGDISRKEYKQ